ncbi:MAG TPA: hypothetical protein VH087_01030 [Thermoanaerobaculia bacterium]|jgi:tungstate transport system substrate-binding protein|nr:hypothetical protein [Thermoanaerobaculia bacterium]
MNRDRILAFVAVLLVATGCAKKSAPRLPVRVATTPEIAATGVVEHLAAVFGAQSGVPVEVVPGAPSATADVVITNDPATVAALRGTGVVRLASTVANDWYLVAGPSRNPAHVSQSGSATEAFRRIFARRQRFCSFADVPAIHGREQRIWAAASIQPEKNRHYEQCKGDALAAFRKASLAGAYVVVDRATFDAVRPERITTFVRGDPLLANDLKILLIEKPKRSKDADWFVEWTMSYRGLDALDNYRVNGHKVFYTQR